MKRFLGWFLILPILFVSFFSLSAFSILEKHEVKNEMVRQKRSTNFKIKEEDFINTMFLRSSFFENWSDTNYFVNPILKTSKSLTYNENWYMDFLKDSYATGIVFDKPSDEFMDLYKNWRIYFDWYKLDRFYNVDRKFFLKDLTNFMYTYFKKYDGRSTAIQGKLEQMRQSIKNLEQVKFNEDNWQIVNDYNNFENNIDNKYYFVIWQNQNKEWKIAKFEHNTKDVKKIGEIIYIHSIKFYNRDNQLKGLYRWDGTGEPIIPTINEDNGEIINWEIDDEHDWFVGLIDIIVAENVRVEQGGSANYEKLDVDGTQKIIFDFEIVDEVDEQRKKKIVYRMILTINREQIIRAGNISLVHYVNDKFDEDKLNFNFSFMQSNLKDKNKNALWNFKIENYIYQKQNKIMMEELNGLIYIDNFLKQFFSNALIPMFTNRGAFLEANYLDFLTYDTVVVNFLGLKADNFLSVVSLENLNNEQEKINFKMKWKNILNGSFKIMNNFYKNYLRIIFDLENETYIQGYHKKFGLLVSNGFKIFPKYFYFSDKYKNLDVKIYSSHANKFYQTKYGRVFNFDYSVFNNFKVDDTYHYLFDEQNKYSLRYKDLSIQKVGYGVFELQSQKENEFYHYYDFNFGIYNWKDLTSLVDKPTGQWWNEQIENCKWYDMVCHIKNGAIWVVNNIPGVKQANELASGVGKLFQVTYSFFVQTFEIWKFNLDFYIVITNTFLLIIFMKFIRMF